MDWLADLWHNFDYDALKAMFTLVNVTQLYHASIDYLAPFAPLLFLSGVVVGFYFVWKFFVPLGQYLWKVLRNVCTKLLSPVWAVTAFMRKLGRNSQLGRYLRKRSEERAMREQLDAAQDSELQEGIIDKIEAMVDGGRMTRKRADDYYAWYSKIHPQLLYAISKFRNLSVKEKILIEQEARDRDPEGKVIPMPLPTAKEVVERKRQNHGKVSR